MGRYMFLLTTIKCIPLVAVRTVPCRRSILPFLYLIRHERREEEIYIICYLLSRLCYDSYLRDFSFLDFVAALLFVIHFSDWIPTRKYSLFLLLLLFHLVFVYSIVFF